VYRKSFRKTPGGVKLRVEKGDWATVAAGVDKKVQELETCLMSKGLIKERIRRDWFRVLVPADWYESKCSEDQLIPSKMNPTLCRVKGLVIAKECEWKTRPSAECPCVCNARAAIVDHVAVATGPNLKLFKAELARIVLYPRFNNPWVGAVKGCL
jgi:hypothetical protein